MNEGWKRIVLVHWQDGAELDDRGTRIAELGYEVATSAREGGAFYRRLKAEPPCALVIDVGREPERGQALARTLRERASTAALPLVFVDADQGSTSDANRAARLLAAFPDAVYCRWSEIETGLARAIKLPIPMHVQQAQSAASVVATAAPETAAPETAATSPAETTPASDRDRATSDTVEHEERRARRRRREQADFESSLTEIPATPPASTAPHAAPTPPVEIDDASTPPDAVAEPPSVSPESRATLAWHLGVREGTRLALLGAPRGFGERLGRLPPAVKLKTSARGKSDVVLLFCSDATAVEKRLPSAARSVVEGGTLWLFAPPALRLGESVPRQFGLHDPQIREMHDGWMAHRYER